MLNTKAAISFLAWASLFSKSCVASNDSAESSDLSLRGSHITDRELALTGAIVALELINANSDSKLLNIVNNQIIDVSKFPELNMSPSFNINAAVSGTDIKSVKFGYNSISNFKIESVAPYAFCGDNNNDFYKCTQLEYGTHTVTATPYSLGNALGEAGPTVSVTFTIVPNIASPIAPTPVAPAAPSAPAPTPAAPTSSTKCSIPKLSGSSWQAGMQYPFPVAESQGAMIGQFFVIVSGFTGGYDAVTVKTYALDTTSTTATWQRMDDLPVAGGITHAGTVVIGTKLYMCGGYLGGVPGPQIDNCLIFDKSKGPGKGQWSSFARLPSGRAGGGLVFDSSRNALFFSGGDQRPSGYGSGKDYNNTWMYSFNTPGDGWISKAPLPFFGNHLSYTTVKDTTGKERHYFFGGQKAENEANGNNSDLYEYDAGNNVWIKRKSMPIPRGHASSSTRAIGCGFIVAGGCTNGGNKISDVSYYNVPTDTWTHIGNLTAAINTPVCDISTGGVLHCESGYATGSYSKKRPIIV